MRGVRGRNLIAVDYEPVEQVLICRFAKSGEYRYRGVPESVFQSLLKVPFADSYFTKVIKGKFQVDKPEKVKDDKGSNVQNATRRNSDSGNDGDAREFRGKDDTARPLPTVSQDLLRDGRRDVGGKGAMTMEFYRQADGLEFIEEGHIYKLNGNRVISLTQILAASGLVDYSGIDPTVLANKAKFGTKVHEYCLWSDKDELDMDDLKPYPTYWNRVEGWRQFVEDFKFKPDLLAAEVPCAVKVNGMLYAMTIDRLGLLDGKQPAVVEIKTCCDREPSHQIQTAAQALPMNEFFKDKGPCKRMAVYLLDKPNQANRYYFCQPHEDRLDEKVFIAALMLTQYRINNKLMKG